MKLFWYVQDGHEFLSKESPEFFDKILGIVEGDELKQSDLQYTQCPPRTILKGAIQRAEVSQLNLEPQFDVKITSETISVPN